MRVHRLAEVQLTSLPLLRDRSLPSPALRPGSPVLVPAYNEAEHRSPTPSSACCSRPSRPPRSSSSTTARPTTPATVARGCWRHRHPAAAEHRLQGRRAELRAASRSTTELVMAIDADTTLAPDAIEQLLAGARRTTASPPRAASCCRGTCSTIWERGRYVEYLLAFSFYKPIQDYYGKPLISSGCFSIYRTDGAARARRLVRRARWPRTWT